MINITDDNVKLPQNDLPRLNVEMDHVILEAKARRLAVAWSQIAEYQGKQDYGFNLPDSLKVQAAGLLSAQIDNEIIEVLDGAAGTADADLTFSRTLPVGVNYTMSLAA